MCPFIPLRYTRIEGESYGRGLIEEYIGDISYLDCISLAIKQASLAASKFIMLVNPQGITDVKKLANTPNGGFASGRDSPDKAAAVIKEFNFDYNELQKEFNENGDITKETRAKLAEAGISGEMVDNFIAGQKARLERYINFLANEFGGIK